MGVKMSGRFRRKAGVVAFVLSTSLLVLRTTSVRKHNLLQEELHADAFGNNSVFYSLPEYKLLEVDIFSEANGLGTDPSGLGETPDLTRDGQNHQIKRVENRNTTHTMACPGNALEALLVFTLIREDLLDLHLLSIDFPVERVFIIQNGAKSEAVQRVLNKYQGCNTKSQQGSCGNPYICNFVVLSGEENIGYAGSFNVGIKAMLKDNIQNAIFSGDDTRFVPGRLKAAKGILGNENACIFHFEGYSSFGITLNAVRLIGPMDENFWPAYCEDCDYWYRAQLAGCRLFYRGGYVPEGSTPDSRNNSFIEHGDVKHKTVSGSSTLRSDPHVSKLVTNTLHASRGRFAYLKRKWGFDTCGLYHKVLNQWRDEDEILNAMSYLELLKHGGNWASPYNDSRTGIRHWIQEDSRSIDAVSSRAVNSQWAPTHYVWQANDYEKLNAVREHEGDDT